MIIENTDSADFSTGNRIPPSQLEAELIAAKQEIKALCEAISDLKETIQYLQSNSRKK